MSVARAPIKASIFFEFLNRATVFSTLCAIVSVALGAACMIAAGAPRRYIVINVAALAFGVAGGAVLRRALAQQQRAGVLALTIGIVLVATALFGVHVAGASRWIRLGGLSLQPSLIFMPAVLVRFSRDRDWLSSAGLLIVAIGLALQPDRAMAATLVGSLGVVWLYRREAAVTVAVCVAAAAFVTTMMRPDTVAPVLFVERVIESAFAFHWLTGVAVITGLLTMLAPSARIAFQWSERETFAVFGTAWAAVILSSLVGNYPTPLVGYGSSAIVGYCLSAAMLPQSSS